MRANSSLSSVIVVVVAVLCACKPAEEPAVLVPSTPLPPAPQPLPPDLEERLRRVEQTQRAPGGGPSQGVINQIRERTDAGGPSQVAVDRAASSDAVPPRPPQKLYFQCADDVTFAVRTVGGVALEVSPPGYPNSYVVLFQQSSEPGAHYYTADRAEFRFDGELATLVLGRDRWVDCVSNPAAAVWQEQPRRGAR